MILNKLVFNSLLKTQCQHCVICIGLSIFIIWSQCFFDHHWLCTACTQWTST